MLCPRSPNRLAPHVRLACSVQSQSAMSADGLKQLFASVGVQKVVVVGEQSTPAMPASTAARCAPPPRFRSAVDSHASQDRAGRSHVGDRVRKAAQWRAAQACNTCRATAVRASRASCAGRSSRTLAALRRARCPSPTLKNWHSSARRLPRARHPSAHRARSSSQRACRCSRPPCYAARSLRCLLRRCPRRAAHRWTRRNSRNKLCAKTAS